MKSILSVLIAATFAACAGAPKYTPGPPMASAPKHAYSVAVLHFDDATAPVLTIMPIGKRQVNLAQRGDPGTPIGAITPEVQAGYFAQELNASRLFHSAHVVMDKGEAQDAALVIEGKVLEALQDIHGGGWTYRFAVELAAKNAKDGAVRWTKTARVEKTWGEQPMPAQLTVGDKTEPFEIKLGLTGGYGTGCSRMLQKMFRALVEDLDKTLSAG